MHHRRERWPGSRLVFGFFLASSLGLSTACAGVAASCETTVIEELTSPGGDMKAVVFDRDCGATTRLSTHVGIYDIDESADTDRRRSVFSRPSTGQGVGVRWVGHTILQIDASSDPKGGFASATGEDPDGRIVTINYRDDG